MLSVHYANTEIRHGYYVKCITGFVAIGVECQKSSLTRANRYLLQNDSDKLGASL